MINWLKTYYQNSKLKGILLSFFPFYHKKVLQEDLRYCGEGLEVGVRSKILYPEFCAFGKNVRIGKNVKISVLAGLVLGDNVVIEDNVVLDDKPLGKAIFIGENSIVKTGNKTIQKPKHEITKDQVFNSNEIINPSNLIHRDKKPFFVVSTGRSGSMSIARILDQHPGISCHHERNSLLIKLATDFAHGVLDKKEATAALNILYTELSVFPNLVYGESDQKISFLIELLSEIIPDARFIWLIRNAHDFVHSATNRGWYSENQVTKFPLAKRWVDNRLSGHLCGEFSENDWNNLSPFEKNCWYWSYSNRKIEEQLAALPHHRHLQIRLEEFNSKTKEIFTFLSVDAIDVSQEIYNKSKHSSRGVHPGQAEALQKWCGAGMKKWFP